MVTIENNKGDMEEKLTDHGDSSCTEDEFLLSQPTEEGEETQSTVEGKEAETAKAASRTRPPYEIFPWLKEVHRTVRTNLKCEYSQRNLLNVMDKCIKHLKEEIPSYLRLPNKSLILSKHITRLLILFKYLNRNFDESTEYLLRMSELLGYYTQLELKYSTKFEESRHLVANRICLHYDLLLQGAQESYILRIFLQVKNCFNQKEVMRKIYEKYLKKPRAQKSELADKLFVMYLVSYKLWKNLEDDKEEQLKIDDYANNFMKPKSSLRTNPNFAPFIPSYKAKSEDSTRCILSEHFNTNSLIQAVKKDDIIDNTEKSLGNIVDLSICDDLPLTDFLKSENDSSSSILLSKTIKLEKPEVIATIDLTAEEKIRAREICWLESLRRKARAAEPIHIPNRCCTTQQSNVIAVIDLDDDEDQVEDVEMRDETNLNAKDLNDENLVSTKLENVRNISENKKNCESFKLPESLALKESVSLDSEHNQGTNIEDHENLEDEVVPKQSITQKKNVVSEIVESSVIIEKNQDSSDKISIPEFLVKENLAKEAPAQNLEEDLSTGVTLPILEANCDILVNDNNNMQVETIVNQEITLSDSSAGQDDAINVSGSKKDTSRSSDTKDVTSETESLREDKQTEMKQQKLTNELEKLPIEHLAESEEKTSPLSERNDFCDDSDELVSLKSGINAVSCKSSEKMQEKFENLSTEKINKEIGTETTTNCPSPYLEVPQSKEQCSSVTKSKDVNDQILNEHDTNKVGEAYDSSKLFDDDDFFKDFTENLATKNPMCKTYQRKKKSAAPNIPVLTIPPVKDSTMLDLPAFSPPSSSECNDDSRDSNSLSILEESEPIDDENFEILLGKPVDIDDTPIEKISPTKVLPSSKPTNASNVVFSMSSNRKISLPPPKEEILPPISSMSSNVVFSTGKQFPAKIDLASSSVRRDSILDDWNEHREELFEENTNSTSTSLLEIDNDEIASPTMEQFTNSDVVDVAQFFGKVTIPPKNIKETTINTDDKIGMEDSIPSQNLSEELKTTIAKTDRITSILNSNAKSRTEFRDTCSSSPLPSVTKKKSVSFVDSPQRKASASIIYPKESIILEKKTYIKPFSINATEPLESWESSINTQITSPSSNQHDVAVKSSCSPRITVRSTWPTANSSPNFEDTGMDKNIFLLDEEVDTQLSVCDNENSIDNNNDIASTFASNKMLSIQTSCESDNNLETATDLSSGKCQVRTDLMNNFLLSPQENFQENGDPVNNENSAHADDDFTKNISPLLPSDGPITPEELDKILLLCQKNNLLSDSQESIRTLPNDESEANGFKEHASLADGSAATDFISELGISASQWCQENFDKKTEDQISLPLKKRRKLSQFSDTISIKDEDVQFIESQKPASPEISSKDVKEVNLTNKVVKTDENMPRVECISYPSTPMLSIANFENMIYFTQPSRRQFKTPAQLKEMTPVTPVNLQTFNILPTQHTIVNNNSAASCGEVARTVQTFNILPSQQTVVSNNGNPTANVQTFNILPSQTNVTSGNNTSIYPDCGLGSTSNEINSVNVGFNLNPGNDLPTLQTFNVSPNSIQYTHTFHPNQQYTTTYSIQPNQTQNPINLPPFDIQNMINLSNYQMNAQHLSNFLHNSQINLQAKQAVLLNDVNLPCSLQINTGQHANQIVQQPQQQKLQSPPKGGVQTLHHIEAQFQSANSKRKIESYDQNPCCVKQSARKHCEDCKNCMMLSPATPTTTGPGRGRPRKNKNRATDRITRSSNRTTVINYKDDGLNELKTTVNSPVSVRKRKNASNHRK